MKINKKIWAIVVVTVPSVYFFLLAFLYTAESLNPDSQIQTMGDALWYSIVTITTVGYGDLTPITGMGRFIGGIFLLLSAGLMVTMISAMLNFIAGEAFPMLLLRFNRQRNWYYFADISAESVVLAKNIMAEEYNALIIFGEKESARQENITFPCYFLQSPLSRLVQLKKDVGNPIYVFFMKENDFGKNTRAIGIFYLPVNVYARTSYGQDSLRPSISFFHSSDCCARQYWMKYPLESHEKQIVLIGFGDYGTNLLERAILTNVRSLDQNVTYHIYGDAETFLHVHSGITQIFRVIQTKENRMTGEMEYENIYHPDSTVLDHDELDTLVFHSEPWEMAHDIIANADRVIICDDDDEVTCRNIYWSLERYYTVKGKVYLRTSRRIPGINFFGTNEEIYNPGEILRTTLNDGAVAMNNIYRKSVEEKTMSWEELPDHLKQSKIAAADHLRMKIRILLEDLDRETKIEKVTADLLERAYASYLKIIEEDPDKLEKYREIEHQRWLRFYAFKNWTYGDSVDMNQHTHPMFRHYRDLPEETRKERENAWDLMKSLAEMLREE
ncbi:MAG: ion channel [Dorea sp.]|nr:ion channel [Dorea sp.]